MSLPALMTTPEVCYEMGYTDRTAIHCRISRGDVRLAACRLPGRAHRSWSRARLVAAGYLVAEPRPVHNDAVYDLSPAPGRAVAVWRLA